MAESTITLQNRHNSTQIRNDLLLYPLISVPLNSAEKLPFAVDDDEHGNSQLAVVQKIRNYRMPSQA